MNKKIGNVAVSAEMLKWGTVVFGSFLILLGTMNRIFSFAALGLYAAMIVFGDEELAVLSIVYVMPFAVLFKSAPGSTTFFTYLMLLFALKQMVTTGILPIQLIPFIAYVIIGQCAAQQIDIQRTIKMLAGLLFIFYAVVSMEHYSIQKLFVLYLVAVILSSMFRFLDSSTFRITQYFDKVTFAGEETRFCGLNNDPNIYVLNVIISLCLLVIMHLKKQIHVIVAVAFAAPLVFFALMTYSKSAVIMLCFPLMLLIFINQKQKKYMLQIIIMLAATSVVLGVLSGSIHAFDTVLERFSSSGGDINQLTTGRTDLWLWYIDYYLSNPRVLFWGRGLGSGLIHYRGVHNVYLQIPFYIGIIGEIWLFSVLRSITRNSAFKRNFVNYSVLICIMIMYFFLSEFFDHQAPIHLLISAAVLNDSQLQGELGNEKKSNDRAE